MDEIQDKEPSLYRARTRYGRFIRLVALSLVMSFAGHDVLQAAPLALTPRDLAHNPNILRLSPSIARISEIHKSSNPHLLIHIQDAHTNVSAQTHIAKILEELIKRYQLKTIFVEGGTKDDSLTFLRPLAPKEARERIAKKYLMRAELKGSEYLSLASDYDMRLLGVEDGALYDRNLAQYARVVENRETVFSYLDEISKRVETVKRRLYPQDILAFDEFLKKYRKQEKDFTDYHARLSTLAERFNINLLDFPNFFHLKELKSKEAAIDFEKASQEQTELVSLLFKDEDNASEAISMFRAEVEKVRDHSVAAISFYEDLLAGAKKQHISEASYPNLILYLDYLRTYSKVDLNTLLEETTSIEETVFERALTDEEALYLHRIEGYLTCVRDLFLLQISKDDFDRYLQMKEKTEFSNIVFLAFLNRKLYDLGNLADIVRYEAHLVDNLKDAEAFYTLSKKRDEVFIEKAVKAMKEGDIPVAALITGGFHTPNLKRLMKEKGLSYIVVTPNIEQETNVKRYEEILLGQLGRRNPLLKNRIAGSSDINSNLAEMLAAQRITPSGLLAIGSVRSDLSAAQRGTTGARAAIKSHRVHLPGVHGAIRKVLKKMVGVGERFGVRAAKTDKPSEPSGPFFTPEQLEAIARTMRDEIRRLNIGKFHWLNLRQYLDDFISNHPQWAVVTAIAAILAAYLFIAYTKPLVTEWAEWLIHEVGPTLGTIAPGLGARVATKHRLKVDGRRSMENPKPALHLQPSTLDLAEGAGARMAETNKLTLDPNKVFNHGPYLLRAMNYFNQVVLGRQGNKSIQPIIWDLVIDLFERFRGDDVNLEYLNSGERSRRLALANDKRVIYLLNLVNAELRSGQSMGDAVQQAIEIYQYLAQDAASDRQLFFGGGGFDKIEPIAPENDPNSASGHHRLAWFLMNFFLIRNGYEPFYFTHQQYNQLVISPYWARKRGDLETKKILTRWVTSSLSGARAVGRREHIFQQNVNPITQELIAEEAGVTPQTISRRKSANPAVQKAVDEATFFNASDTAILAAIESLKARNVSPITQELIAEEAGVTPQTISNRKSANPAVQKAVDEIVFVHRIPGAPGARAAEGKLEARSLRQEGEDKRKEKERAASTGKSESMARRNEFGGNGLQINQAFSKGGNVRPYSPDADRSRVNSIQHRGRQRQEPQEGVSSVSFPGQRFSLRINNPYATGEESGVFGQDSIGRTFKPYEPTDSNADGLDSNSPVISSFLPLASSFSLSFQGARPIPHFRGSPSDPSASAPSPLSQDRQAIRPHLRTKEGMGSADETGDGARAANRKRPSGRVDLMSSLDLSVQDPRYSEVRRLDKGRLARVYERLSLREAVLLNILFNQDETPVPGSDSVFDRLTDTLLSRRDLIDGLSRSLSTPRRAVRKSAKGIDKSGRRRVGNLVTALSSLFNVGEDRILQVLDKTIHHYARILSVLERSGESSSVPDGFNFDENARRWAETVRDAMEGGKEPYESLLSELWNATTPRTVETRKSKKLLSKPARTPMRRVEFPGYYPLRAALKAADGNIAGVARSLPGNPSAATTTDWIRRYPSLIKLRDELIKLREKLKEERKRAASQAFEPALETDLDERDDVSKSTVEVLEHDEIADAVIQAVRDETRRRNEVQELERILSQLDLVIPGRQSFTLRGTNVWLGVTVSRNPELRHAAVSMRISPYGGDEERLVTFLEPLRGVKIVAFNLNANSTVEAVPSENGTILFENLLDGRYQFWTQPSGARTALRRDASDVSLRTSASTAQPFFKDKHPLLVKLLEVVDDHLTSYKHVLNNFAKYKSQVINRRERVKETIQILQEARRKLEKAKEKSSILEAARDFARIYAERKLSFAVAKSEEIESLRRSIDVAITRIPARFNNLNSAVVAYGDVLDDIDEDTRHLAMQPQAKGARAAATIQITGRRPEEKRTQDRQTPKLLLDEAPRITAELSELSGIDLVTVRNDVALVPELRDHQNLVMQERRTKERRVPTTVAGSRAADQKDFSADVRFSLDNAEVRQVGARIAAGLRSNLGPSRWRVPVALAPASYPIAIYTLQGTPGGVSVGISVLNSGNTIPVQTARVMDLDRQKLEQIQRRSVAHLSFEPVKAPAVTSNALDAVTLQQLLIGSLSEHPELAALQSWTPGSAANRLKNAVSTFTGNAQLVFSFPAYSLVDLEATVRIWGQIAKAKQTPMRIYITYRDTLPSELTADLLERVSTDLIKLVPVRVAGEKDLFPAILSDLDREGINVETQVAYLMIGVNLSQIKNADLIGFKELSQSLQAKTKIFGINDDASAAQQRLYSAQSFMFVGLQSVYPDLLLPAGIRVQFVQTPLGLLPVISPLTDTEALEVLRLRRQTDIAA